ARGAPQLVDVRQLLAARVAPARPEVDDRDGVARAQAELAALEERQREGRRRVALADGTELRHVARDPHHAQNEERAQPDEEEQAGGRGREVAARAHDVLAAARASASPVRRSASASAQSAIDPPTATASNSRSSSGAAGLWSAV